MDGNKYGRKHINKLIKKKKRKNKINRKER